MANIKFNQLIINDWKQFEKIEIDFHPQLTVLTGANGCGKTTILNLLARHFGWSHTELATPAEERSSGIFKYIARFFKSEKSQEPVIGEIHYSNKTKAILSISNNKDSAQYTIMRKPHQDILGVSIPSHRPTYFYRQVPHISTSRRSKQQAHILASESSKSYYFTSGGQPSNFYIKETLLSWAIAGEGNKYMPPDLELKRHFEEFQDVLRKLLPPVIGFNEIQIRNFEIVFITNSGDFMLDAVSGGVSAIIDLAWQIFTFGIDENESLTILIDEVENHLHPEMQRSIMPSLISAFPKCQFIISTHSPLIVGSVKNSNVYVFRHKIIAEERTYKVTNEKLDLVNKAKTATEILNEVLGVPFTMPLWVENQLNEIVAKYTQGDMDEFTFDKMRSELKEIGLEELMPEAIKKSLNKND